MSETAYHRDCRLTELATEVVAAGEGDGSPFVVLADTIFYPEGGGQPADHGRYRRGRRSRRTKARRGDPSLPLRNRWRGDR